MHRSLYTRLLASCAALLAPAAFAAPQWGGDGYGDANDLIRCESRDNRTQRCPTGGYDAQLVRQFSDSPCRRNRTWGVDRDGIWVSGGCRAEFSLVRSGYGGNYGGGYGDAYGNDRTIRCESRNGRQNYCDTGGAYVVLVRQLSDSACIEGRTWGQDRRGVWVGSGCRADFRIDEYGGGSGVGGGYGGNNGNDLIRCESSSNRTRTCPIASSGSRRYDLRLIRQLSDSPCVEGETWGRSASGVWVTRGCRAEFVVERRGRGNTGRIWPPADGSSEGGNAGAQTIRCESNDQRTSRCDTAGARNVELSRQLSDAPCVRGDTWNWDRGGVWVSRGCRAEFRVW